MQVAFFRQNPLIFNVGRANKNGSLFHTHTQLNWFHASIFSEGLGMVEMRKHFDIPFDNVTIYFIKSLLTNEYQLTCDMEIMRKLIMRSCANKILITSQARQNIQKGRGAYGRRGHVCISFKVDHDMEWLKGENEGSFWIIQILAPTPLARIYRICCHSVKLSSTSAHFIPTLFLQLIRANIVWCIKLNEKWIPLTIKVSRSVWRGRNAARLCMLHGVHINQTFALKF